ncbi:hypothetical protein [Haloarcula salinisoli]|uniref:Uncharacterized protein n=1 Tax=Haloarcula salinisoli TaxID=2487746 RepID=A0A8J8C9R9_9EURY|nr:hypothetical protein [Halomicroarcula salinisoli]MBX0288408.1 hypothetical protein [Halomicroarcula salinisoli]MBX0305891.1 hypothetical protein [Halomicroarcula salinisoli]
MDGLTESRTPSRVSELVDVVSRDRELPLDDTVGVVAEFHELVFQLFEAVALPNIIVEGLLAASPERAWTMNWHCSWTVGSSGRSLAVWTASRAIASRDAIRTVGGPDGNR